MWTQFEVFQRFPSLRKNKDSTRKDVFYHSEFCNSESESEMYEQTIEADDVLIKFPIALFLSIVKKYNHYKILIFPLIRDHYEMPIPASKPVFWTGFVGKNRSKIHLNQSQKIKTLLNTRFIGLLTVSK